jgi:membrane-bound ClpP family serine protease
MSLGVLLVVIGAICLIVYYAGVHEAVLRIVGIIALLIGLVLLVVPALDDADAALASAATVLGWRLP